MSERLDKYLVLNGYYPSRTKAQDGILNHEISVNGNIVDTCKLLISANDQVVKVVADEKYVSRGAYKLLKAFEAFSINVENLNALDIGASTGGFTQVLLEKGAKRVCALDVGYNQLADVIRNDSRVDVLEKANFRHADLTWFKQPFDFFCTDVSFISLKLIIPVINTIVNRNAQGVLLIKPQFEAGKENINKHGIVTNKNVHVKVIYDIINCVSEYGFGVKGLCKSDIRGKDGNIEYLLYIEYNGDNSIVDVNNTVKEAFIE